MRRMTCVAAMVLGMCGGVWALPVGEAQKLYERVQGSLVAVQYTMEGEYGRREFTGLGVVVGEEGVVVTPLALFPTGLPDEQMKGFKIILPGDEEQEVAAVFLGRDERSELAFLKTKEKQKWVAIQFEDAVVKVAEQVVSVGLLPKEAGFKAFYAEAMVSAVLRGPIPQVLVSPGGLAGVGSPVFNAEGKAIGLVPFQARQSILLMGNAEDLQAVTSPPRLFVPARDFLASLADPPTGKPLAIPWLGAQLTGPSKEVAEYYNLKGVPVAMVGDVIPDAPAAKAGMRQGDKVIKLNGLGLERGDEPAETPQILVRKLRRMKVGQVVKLTVLRGKGQPESEVSVVLEEQPKGANLAKRFYTEDLGVSVREVVFSDTYVKRLPANTKGVVVAYVRQASATATAGLKIGDFVKELNSVPVEGLGEFKSQYLEFRKNSPKDVVVWVVVREGGTQVIKVEPPQ